MATNSYFKKFEALKNKHLEKLKSDYLSQVNKARKKVNAHNGFSNSLQEEYKKWFQQVPENLKRFMIDVMDVYDADSAKEIPEIFNQHFKKLGLKNSDTLLEILAKIDAHTAFYEFWHSQDETYRDFDESTEGTVTEKIDWQGKRTQLAELFIELKRHGWIAEINSKLISSYFSVQGKALNPTTIYELLKERPDKNGVPTYENTYTKRFKKSFNNIEDVIKNKE